ncbi:flagellar hook-associated protein FlgK [Allosphingosinicella deserti]|uniref:Flagellar hook-associated protein 1 n=1 Tax=Allosphingosinicella deserti TaxID=2116704 RepID=A0A2P7QNV8_9SPHN|nr:flagellar hook-associated protein FlgK [Sphingomonas deserti]PSJ39652.1 flagellar hook-associated protein FlgK [Sphingomonas deserti]
MSDLLAIGLSGVTAYRTALAAVADNVANAENPGYARREVRLREGINTGSRSPLYREDLLFAGVEAASVARAWDAYRAADARYAASGAGRAAVREQWLGAVETALGDGPSSVGTAIGGFFNAGEALAATPSDRLARSAMLTALSIAAGEIRETAEALQRVATGIADAAATEVDGLNADLAALAEVNDALRQSKIGGTARASMEDERDRLIDSIAVRIDVEASIEANGTASLTLARVSGVTLLDQTQRATVGAATAADGRIALTLFANGTTTPLPATGGRLSGLVDVAGSTADKRAELNATAQQFVDEVNDWQAGGRTPTGTPGAALLVMTGDASTLATTTGNPAAIAAASGAGVENGNLLVLGDLRGPGGVESRWAALVASHAQALQSARSEASAAATRRDGSFAARDEVSGIDLDQEAAELLRYQRAYDGSAKIVQVARDTLQSILDLF